MAGLDLATQSYMGKLEFMALGGRELTFIVSDKRLLASGHDEDECFSYKNDGRVRYVSAYGRPRGRGVANNGEVSLLNSPCLQQFRLYFHNFYIIVEERPAP